jgi:coenzyme F420 hydrogenase subunit beta
MNNLKKKKILSLKNINLKNTVKMHAHMLEFKKIGSYLRIEKFKKKGSVPLYDLKPADVTLLRRLIESMIGLIILACSNNFIRSFFSIIGSSFMGYLFQLLRKFWKFLTKTTKRKGLKSIKFTKVNNNRLNEFLSK